MKFTMLDIIEALNLPYPPPGRASYNINCPNCDVPPHKPKKHLNINLQKDVFCCPKCGSKGGMFDLYALFTGIDRHQVIRVLTGSVQAPQRKWTIKNTQTPLAAIDIRNSTYSALLQHLPLSHPHYANLRERGDKLLQPLPPGGIARRPFAGRFAAGRRRGSGRPPAPCKASGRPGTDAPPASGTTAGRLHLCTIER